MIEFKITSPEDTAPRPLTIDFQEAVVVEASIHSLLEGKGTPGSPFNMDSLVKWPAAPDGIFSLTTGISVEANCKNGSQIKDVQLLQGFIKKLSTPEEIWGSPAQWTRYFTWSSTISSNLSVSPTGEVKFDLHEMRSGVYHPIFDRSSNSPDSDTYFSFGFTFSYRALNDSKQFFGRVDPLLKISTGN